MRTRRPSRARDAPFDRHRAGAPAAALRTLQDSWQQLSPELDLGEACTLVVERAAMSLGASGGFVVLRSNDGRDLELVGHVGLAQEAVDVLRHVSIGAPLPWSEAVRANRPVLLGTAEERDELFPEMERSFGPDVVVAVVPMLASDGSASGAVGFLFDEPQRYDEVDRELLVALARQCAQAIERSRLVADLRRSLARERDARADLSFAAEAGAALGRSLDLDATLDRLSELVVPHLADWCCIDLVEDGDDGSGETPRLRHVVRHAGGLDASEQALQLRRRWGIGPADPIPPQSALGHGSSALIEDVSPALLDAWFADAADVAAARELGVSSIVSVPLVAHGATIAVLTLFAGVDRAGLGARELALARTLADRAAAAIDNARMYRAAADRARASQVLEHIGDGVLLVDRAGVIELWNRAAETITGIRERDAIGRPARLAIPGWREIEERVPVTVLPHSGSVSFQTLPMGVRSHDGDGDLWVSISGVQFPEGTVYAFRDVTDERAIERMKSDFVATVSHELRTPLASVYGAAMTLQRTDLLVDEASRGQLLEIIASESDRLGRIVNDILLASHIDSGRLRLHDEPFVLDTLLAEVVESTVTRISAGTTVTLESPEVGPIRLVGDRDRLRQVFVNLVENAIKYSPDGGEVVVSARLVDDGRMARVDVRDQGLGISPPEQRKVFEKFFRADPNLNRGIGGTGLGLYICRELVARMGGRISLESKLGEGSTFSVQLPLAGVPGGRPA